MWADDRALRWRKIFIHLRKKNNEKNVPKNMFHQSDLFFKNIPPKLCFAVWPPGVAGSTLGAFHQPNDFFSISVETFIHIYSEIDFVSV